ncbi:MAG: NrdH-redoxin [Acidimicrobiia bacterium]|nr:NrdH-redoxin [Acidimicrobiia bacterium]
MTQGADDQGWVDQDSATVAVDVYWRPGCPFCSVLFRSLRRAGLPMREVNIWEDPDAAAFVRAHARGNETVPTVDVAGTVLVNPPAKAVLAYAADAGIALGEPEG